MKPANITIREEPLLSRFERVRAKRGHKKVTKTIRELAVERLLEIEQHGDTSAVSEDSHEFAGVGNHP